MKVLITGHSGFIGKSIIKELDSSGISYRKFTGDILNIESFSINYECDTLLHLASITCISESTIPVNIVGTINSLEYARKNKMDFVFASTCNNKKDNIYSFSKITSEEIIREYCNYYGLNCVIVRIFNVYGPGQKEGFVIPDTINKVLYCEHIDVFNPDSVRDFIYIDDLVDLIVLILQSRINGFNIINAGTSVGTKIIDITTMIMQFLCIKKNIITHNNYDKTPVSIANISKTKLLYNWNPVTTINDGIKNVIKSRTN